MSNIDGQALRQFLAEQKLDPAVAERFTALLRPQIKLVPTGPFDTDETPPWASKLGGFPDLPVGTAWPLHGALEPDAPKDYKRNTDWEIGPLEFMAQINLADVARVGSGLPLPEEGLLLFFYDARDQPWGFRRHDALGWRVICVPAGVETKRQVSATPEHVHTRPLELVASEVMPDWSSLQDHLSDDLSVIWGELDGLDEFYDAIASDNDGEEHVFGGWPRIIQNPMELECEMVTQGLNESSSEPYRDPRMPTVHKNAQQWRLLLQLDSDDRLDWMWGDMGMVYFWCREEDIAAARFDRVWTILQCG